jgi:bifunctional DNA-binding transcriptional regulator/antitoxin component of YhaV-PrlF toxin-antitoxin module
MTLTADSRGRIASLELFPPGASFEPEVEGTRIILKRLAPEEHKRVLGKLVTRNGRLMMEVSGEITADAIAKAVREERDSRA